MKSNQKILAFAWCLFLAKTISADTYWIAPANNQVPLGAAGGVASLSFPVYDPTSGQLIQPWIASFTSPYSLYYSTYDGVSWNTPANNLIPLGLSSGMGASDAPSADPGSGQVLQIWQDSMNSRFYYAVYNGTGWSTPSNNEIPLGSSAGIRFDAFNPATYDSTSNQLVQIWEDSVSHQFYYATYDGVTWSAPSDNAIPMGSSTTITTFYDSTDFPSQNQFIQVWTDNSAVPRRLYYAVYDGTSWSAPADNAIPLGSSTNIQNYGAQQSIYCPGLNQVVQVWQDVNNSLYYATYDGTSWTANSGNILPLGSSTLVSGLPIYLAFDTATGQLVETWTDGNNNLLYYATYDGTSWSAPVDNQIPLGSAPNLPYQNDPINNPFSREVIQTWEDSGNALIYYANYDGTNWDAPTGNQIPLGLSTEFSGFSDPIFLAASNQLVQVWYDGNSGQIYYAYQATLDSPANGYGKRVKNRFPYELERFNLLSWDPANGSFPVLYTIERDGQVIETGYPGTQYRDYNRPKNGTSTYIITAVDSNGHVSSPLTISVE